MMRSATTEHHLYSPFSNPSSVPYSFLQSHYPSAPSHPSMTYSIDEMEVIDVMEKFKIPKYVEDFSVFDTKNPFHLPDEYMFSPSPPFFSSSHSPLYNSHLSNPFLRQKNSTPKKSDKIIHKEKFADRYGYGKTKKYGNGNYINSIAGNSLNRSNNTPNELNDAVLIISSLKKNSLSNSGNNNNNTLNNSNNNTASKNLNNNNNNSNDSENKELPPIIINNNSRLNDLNGIKVPFTIKMYKRLNGNQPWVESHVSPPMIGKMRKVTIEFETVPRPLQLRIDIKQICSKGNQSTLVISESNRIYKKTQKAEGCDTASYVIEASPQPQTKTLYLKPCWVCFGPRKDRPEFQVIISIVDLRTNKSEILHCWNTEIHCHKMESSMRGKSMDTNCPPSFLESAFYL